MTAGPTLALFVITVAAWAILEAYFIGSGQPTITDRVREVYRQWPPLGMLAGLAAGLLLAHFFFS